MGSLTTGEVPLSFFPRTGQEKKQEGTAEVFIESTNAHFQYVMETLYFTVS